MKKIFLYILFCLFSYGWSQQETARISIYSSPDHVQIRLDSVIIGKTPLIHIEIPPGEHRLEALSPFDGLWNIANIVKKFLIKVGEDTVIKIRFSHPVKINSIPFHARLLHKNRFIGFTPLTLPFEENRGKEFLLEKKGYRNFQFILNKSEPYLITLEPLEINTKKTDDGPFVYTLFHKQIKTKFLLLTGTVVSHWMAFYFKNLADKNFKKYQKTADPTLISKYWDNTQRYDRYSDISLAISYAFLTGLIYTVLWD